MTREPGRAPPRHAHGDLTSLAPHERLPEKLVYLQQIKRIYQKYAIILQGFFLVLAVVVFNLLQKKFWMNIRKINHGRVNTVEANYKKQSKFILLSVSIFSICSGLSV